MRDEAARLLEKAFISYSWTTPEHEDWVVRLATRLVEDGVDVELDKWALKIGHDKFAYMEKMVTDATVTKVLMICDRVYAEKADGRSGGVGAETQILTPELYKSKDQDKFAALILEKDNDGNAFVPTYYKGRIYMDFSEPAKFESSYEDLLRWIYNRPINVKPALGMAPAFITSPTPTAVGANSKLRRAEEAIAKAAANATGLIREYGAALISELKQLAPIRAEAEPFDETVVRAVEAMRPYLRQLNELQLAIARSDGSAVGELIHINELIAELMWRPTHVTQWFEDDFDAYKIISYEAFLSFVAILLSEKRYDLVGTVLSHPYYVRRSDGMSGPSTSSFDILFQFPESISQRNRRLATNKTDPLADFVNETYKSSYPPMADIIQADLVIYLRAAVDKDAVGYYAGWYPHTILYADRFRPSELFARSESVSFFESWAPKVFGKITVGKLKEEMEKMNSREHQIARYGAPTVASLGNYAHIGTRA